MKVLPPFSPYGTFHGTLFQYKSCPSLVAFESCPPITSSTVSSPLDTSSISSQVNQHHLPKNKCILLGGLSDGLIPTPYTLDLEKICHELGWSLVQPILSSSYLGFGNGNLQRDTNELNELLTYLIHHRQAENFAIVGHSTGCQNSVHYTKFGDEELIPRVKVIALQAPVSDREGPMHEDIQTYNENINHAKDLVKNNKGDEMMPRKSFWAPITACRFLALQDRNGEDDFFSSDLSNDELKERLGHIGECGLNNGLKVLVAYSEQDEYVPGNIDKDLLLDKLCIAMNSGNTCKEIGEHDIGKYTTAIPLMLRNSNHNLSEDEEDKLRFIQEIRKLLSSVT